MILVTGGTGVIGSELLRLLSHAGIPARALTRNPQKAQELPGITWVAGDLARPATLTPAFEGARTVFLLTHYLEDMVELQHNAIAAARVAGVTHIVKASAFAASAHSNAPIGRWHYEVEQELQASGVGWTMLRPHHFMQNLLAQAEYVINDSAIYSPSGDGRIPYIAANDVAAVAFVTLTQPGHLAKKYVLTGREAMSYRQAAEIIGNVIGKKVRFVDESPEDARARRVREGVPPAVIESILAIGAYQRAGGSTLLGGAMSIRAIKQRLTAEPTLEGAGVELHRGFGFGKTDEFDPFLLFDDFRNDRPNDYLAGFPWHPHRGIETITYVLAGTVAHGDSLGNEGTLGAGDVQWMTAGSGIIHQEMPRGDDGGRMHGFQLWGNLPSSLKMTAPRYQEVTSSDIPDVVDDDGTRVKIVSGTFWGKRGPVDGVAADPIYLDVSVPPGRRKILPVETTRHAFAYVFAGSGSFRDASRPQGVLTDTTGELDESPVQDLSGNRTLILFDRGDEVTVQAGPDGIRFLLVSGKPLGEPVAWHGPIVMNTQDEIRQALTDLRNGTFIK